MTVTEIAAHIDAEVAGAGDVKIRGIAKIETAGAGELTFIANPKYLKFLETTGASAIIVPSSMPAEKLPGGPQAPVLLRVDDPYAAFMVVLGLFHPQPDLLPPGIHPSAVIAESATIGADVRIGANAVVGEGCDVGARTVVGPSAVLGYGVRIGEDTVLYPNVTVLRNCRIGSRVIVHSGTVVGSDGFGFAPRKDGTYTKVPQTGIVVVEDDVEIGSNCSLDRATMGETIIKKGAKLDNLIQIAHNVVIGENTVIASQAGVSGSTKIGKNCIIAGQVGLVGHIELADNITIAAQSGLSKSLKKSGVYFGSPAKEMGRALRIEAATRRLPEMAKEFDDLKREVERLKNRERSAADNS
jgi:UDP-3-O-[3-hydroxymyristoyl] glucosamine N-acyltransferase